MKEPKYNAASTGALREALGVPYLRQVPLEAVAAGATSLEYGAIKYAHRNWEKGLPWQQMIDSLRRHLDDFERRRDYDDGPDGSGLHQVCMIMASAMMLSASVIRHIGDDDRLPKLSDEAYSAKDCAKWMKMQLEHATEFAKMKESMKSGT
jgi:hypothetical protein